MDRFEIAKMYKVLDAKSFLRYLLTLEEVLSKTDLVNFLKFLLQEIKRFSTYSLISSIKGLNPFIKGEDVDYDYSKTPDYHSRIKSFLNLALGVHDLYLKDEYLELHKELSEYLSEKGISSSDILLTKDGYFKIPGVNGLVTLVPDDIYKEAVLKAKQSKMDISGMEKGVTASGKHILDVNHPAVNSYILGTMLDIEKDGAVEKPKPEKVQTERSEKVSMLHSTNSKWEKCDASKDRELKKELREYEKWEDISVRFTAQPSLKVMKDDKYYYIKLPGVVKKDRSYKKIGEVAERGSIVKIPKNCVREQKNGMLSIVLNLGRKFELCDKEGQSLGSDLYGMQVADAFEIKDICVKPSEHKEKSSLTIDGEDMKEFFENGFTFAYSDKRAVILEYAGKEKEITTPEAINVGGKRIPVDEIKDRAFADRDISSIKIHEGVKEICNGAFADCKELREVSLPSTLVSLGTGIFNGCSLDKMSMKDNERVRLDKGLLIYEEKVLKAVCSEKNITIPDDVCEIDEYAFEGAENKEINLNNARKIGACAFKGSSFEVVFGDKVVDIGEQAFKDSDVKSFDLSHIKTIGTEAFSGSKLEKAELKDIRFLGERAFENAHFLSEVVVDTANLDKEAYRSNTFSGCTSLSQINWKGLSPDEIKTLEEKKADVLKSEYVREIEADTKDKAITDYKEKKDILERYRADLEDKLHKGDLTDIERIKVVENIHSIKENLKTLETGIDILEPKKEKRKTRSTNIEL